MNGTPMMQYNKQHFDNTQQFYSESGRSLVEMLGTLAVMGVLTIGGIAGFNYAMNKQRANATVGYVNQLAVLGTGQMLAGGTPKLLDYPDHTPSGYPVAIKSNANKTNTFDVEIDNVPTAVCNDMMDRLDSWKMVNDMGTYAPENQPLCGDGTVKMWFEITATADKGESDYHCDTSNDCKNRFGNNFICNSKRTCELSCPSGQVKTPVGCCAADKVFNGGCCKGTVMEEDGVKKCCPQTSDFLNHPQCCPAGTFPYKDNQCISCDDPQSYYYWSHWDFCTVCANRVIEGTGGCSAECHDGAVRLNGRCHCPEDRPLIGIGWYNSDGGKCFPCDSIVGNISNNSTSVLGYETGNTSQTGHYCNRRNGGGYSFYCAKGTIGVSWNDTVRRKVDGEWVNYKSEKNNGECISCSEIDISALKYQAQCESCGWKWVGVNWYTGLCEPKN